MRSAGKLRLFEAVGVGVLILGLSAYYRDSAAALIRNGEIVAAAQEERFTRKLRDGGFPTNAVAYCLQEAHITLADIDYVVFYHPSSTSRGIGSLLSAVPMWLKENLQLKITLKKELARLGSLGERALPRILFSEHHRALAASAFFASPFHDAAVLCLGTYESADRSVWLGAGNTLTQQTQIKLPDLRGIGDQAVLKFVRTVQRELRQDRVCLTADVTLSPIIQASLLREGSVNNIWFQPAAGAAAGALGAGLSVWYEHLSHARNVPASADSSNEYSDDFMRGSYLGPWFSSEGIVDYLDDIKAPYKKLDDDVFYREVGIVLAAEKTVGWFQGRMQFGATGLGARSIIGDARSKKMQSILDQQAKSSESSSLEYFPPAPMGLNPRLNKLRDYYAGKEGCSIQMTSFNLHDEPVVCTPDDAYRCFMRSELDCLVLENIILHKHEQPLWEQDDAPSGAAEGI